MVSYWFVIKCYFFLVLIFFIIILRRNYDGLFLELLCYMCSLKRDFNDFCRDRVKVFILFLVKNIFCICLYVKIIGFDMFFFL